MTTLNTNDRLELVKGRPNFAFEVAGLRIGLWWGNLDLPEDDLRRILPPGWRPVAPRDLGGEIFVEQHTEATSPVGLAGFHIYADGTFMANAVTLSQAILQLESTVEHLVAEHSPTFLFMHAGVVRWGNQAIVLPGSSHAGKSTLVTALTRAGAIYYSDEWAVLDESSTVFPYPRQLSLREGPFGPAGRVDLSHLAPGGHPGKAGIPVGLVILCKFEADGNLRLDQLGAGEAMMAMSQHIVGIRHRPAAAMTTLARIVATAPVLQGTRGDAATAAGRILGAIDAAGPVHDPVVRGAVIHRTLQGALRSRS